MSSCKRKVYIIHSNYLRCSLGGFFNMSEERNIYQILRNIAQNDPDHLILTDAYDDFTYSDLVQMTDSFTGVLLKKGIKPGDHVALWGTNTGNWLAAFLGIQQVGAVAVLVNYALGVDDVTALMKMTRCSALVYGGSKALLRDYHAPEKIANALSIPADKVICALTPMINFKSLPKVTLPPLPPVDPHKSTFIIFTTGTTSLPKAVLLKQYSMLNDVDFIAKEIMQFVNPVTIMVSVPAFHCFGLIATLYGILKSKYMYLPETYEPSSLLAEVAKRNLTFLISVGTIFANIANIPGVEAMLPDCIKIAVLGGGSMTPTQFMRLESLFKGTKFLNAYGQTESSVVISIPRPTDSLEVRSRSVGHISGVKDVRIMDAAGNILEKGKKSIGEIVVHDDGNIMEGYYGLPAEQQPIDENGWLHTGDLGYLDDDGFLYIVGRSKDIIIKGGENISPSEIETALYSEDSVREAKVFGVSHPVYGEDIECCVVPTDEATFDQDALKASLRTKISPFKIPTHFVLFKDFPLNANNKLDVRTLKSEMAVRLRRILIDEDLSRGILVSKMTIKNTTYSITPVVAFARCLAESIGYSDRRVNQICLATEEMLTERIMNAYSDIGDIQISFLLMEGWLEIRFTDNGERFVLDKNEESSLSVKIIVKVADMLDASREEAGKPVYSLGFLYDNEIDIHEYLYKHEK